MAIFDLYMQNMFRKR